MLDPDPPIQKQYHKHAQTNEGFKKRSKTLEAASQKTLIGDFGFDIE
jgi:hypothetical protein